MIGIFTNLIAPRKFVTTLLIFLCCGCASTPSPNEFFDKGYDQAGSRFKEYSIPDQINIYLYGVQFVTPPVTVLSRSIAEHGQAAIPHLLGALGRNPADQNVKDLMVVFEAMQNMATYNVQHDQVLMHKLESYVNSMSKGIVYGYTRGTLDRLERFKYDAD